MKRITLYGASLRNDGSYVDAGATIDVGDEPGQISAERAKEISDSGRGAAETTAKAAEVAAAPVAPAVDVA